MTVGLVPIDFYFFNFFFVWCCNRLIQNEKKICIYCNVLKVGFHHLFQHHWVYVRIIAAALRAPPYQYSDARGFCGTALAVLLGA